jgi:hypothetical protein
VTAIAPDRLLTWDEAREELESGYELWLAGLLPGYMTAPLGAHHHDYWRWVWSIESSGSAPPFIGVWARGGAKSTSAEGGVVALASRRRRRYGLYVCRTQDQADQHVGNVGAMLESELVGLVYPDVGQKALGKFGNPKAWRRNRMSTASGFTLDALGLDTAARGLKMEDQRPDLIVLDDLDDAEDSLEAVRKNVSHITKKIIPAGATNVVILAIQNLVHPEGIFARLAGLSQERADFLARRHLSGPVPAVDGLAVDLIEDRWTITAGRATWAGYPLAAAQHALDTEGLTAFLSERQHEVSAPPGGLYNHVAWAHCRYDEVPTLVETVVWVDPAVTDTDSSDSQAIQCDGLGVDDRVYRLFSWERRSSPQAAIVEAFTIAHRYGATTVGVETDQGGDTWASVYREAWDTFRADNPHAVMPQFASDKAGAGHGSKVERSSRMLADYERPGRRIVHVTTTPEGTIGTHEVLERALRRFPRTKPLDLADAAYWSWHDLTAGQIASAAPAGVARSEPVPWSGGLMAVGGTARRPW